MATLDSLERAAKAYFDAFCAAPHDYYPGINALSLGRLWEDLSGKACRLALPLGQIADGVGWTLAAANQRKESYWAYFTLAELELVRNRRDETLEAYRKAADMAVADSNRFALDSARQQLAVTQSLADGSLRDVTSRCRFAVEPPEIATVTSGGVVIAAANGAGLVRVTWGGQTAIASLRVERTLWEQPVSFRTEFSFSFPLRYSMTSSHTSGRSTSSKPRKSNRGGPGRSPCAGAGVAA